MLTAGDIEFEPPFPKLFPLTNSIALLIAGDTSAHGKLILRVAARVSSRLAADQSWMGVEEAAAMVAAEVTHYRLEVAEQELLGPFGLTMSEFLQRQGDFSPDWVSDMTSRVLGVKAEVKMIVAGVDQTPAGARIFIVNGDGSALCNDLVGFASIGLGEWHADSHFMFAQHTRNSAVPETLLRTYAAKRRAEVAPSVGTETDMFSISGLGRYAAISEQMLLDLKGRYEDMERAQRDAIKVAHDKLAADFSAAMKAQEATMAQQEAPLRSSPSSGDAGDQPSNGEASTQAAGGAKVRSQHPASPSNTVRSGER
jgi:hypothetical protein